MPTDQDPSGQAQSRMRSTGLRVLAVDDEAPSLADLVYELRALPAVASVSEAGDATEALRALRSSVFDVVFLDVRMPGLDGLELARVLSQFRSPPPVVFVTAFDAHAVDAFEINAVDYLLKPVRPERLELAVSKVLNRQSSLTDHVVTSDANGASHDGDTPMAATAFAGHQPGQQPSPARNDLAGPVKEAEPSNAVQPKHPFDEDLISIESGGRIRVVDRRDVLFVESSGDYVRLHLVNTSVLVRVAMSTLEEHWADAGFVRIHRSYLVSLSHVSEVLVEHGHGYRVKIGERSLPVSRRLANQLRARLVDYAARRVRPSNGFNRERSN